MKRIFTLLLGALAMLAVALVSAFITMRLAIHGREAVVPALTGLTMQQGSAAARSKGLSLALENRFYSSGVASGRIIAQDPPAGTRVRRDWPVRIIESLGAQRVHIPDLIGESERAATVSIRRLSLELGSVAYLAVGGEPDVVLAQTPPANSEGIDGPRVSLLLSDDGLDSVQQDAYVMPSLLGLSYRFAADRAAIAGLHLIISSAAPSAGDTPTTMPTIVPAATPLVPTSGTITSQWPLPGHRVVRGDAVHIVLSTPVASVMPAP